MSRPLGSSSRVPSGCRKIRMPSSSALAQTGWNFGSASSCPATLPPIESPRSPKFLTACSSCSTASCGCCNATVAKATNRSGVAAQNSASFSFWIRISSAAASRSARYQNGLMLSASTSTPSASISAMRSETLDHRSPGASSGWLITAAASGTTVWAWISTVLTRLPLTTTSRRLPGCADPCRGWLWAACAGRARIMLQPTKAMPASAPVSSSALIAMTRLPLIDCDWRNLSRRHHGALPVCVGSTRKLACADRGQEPFGGAIRSASLVSIIFAL